MDPAFCPLFPKDCARAIAHNRWLDAHRCRMPRNDDARPAPARFRSASSRSAGTEAWRRTLPGGRWSSSESRESRPRLSGAQGFVPACPGLRVMRDRRTRVAISAISANAATPSDGASEVCEVSDLSGLCDPPKGCFLHFTPAGVPGTLGIRPPMPMASASKRSRPAGNGGKT
jgi:hypothetical protein